MELSRRDDLESLGYMLIYLATGDLPWIKLPFNLNFTQKKDYIKKLKEITSMKEISKKLPI